MAKKYTFKVGDSIYDIPEDRVDAFRKSKPDAIEVESYVVGKDTFDIPLDLVGKFKEKRPEAKPLYEAEAEKKKNIQPSPKPKQEAGGGFGAGLDRQYLDHFVTATGNVAKKFQWKGTADEDAYFRVLKKNNKFSDEQIGYIREQYNAKNKEWKAGVSRFGEKPEPVKDEAQKEEIDLSNIIERQQKLASKKMSPDEYAEQVKKESDDAYVAYQKKVKDESADFYLANSEKYGDKFGGLYLAYLQEKNPARYEQIQRQIASGDWDKGADPQKKAKLEELGRAINSPFLAPAYEIYAEIIGENNLENTAQLYKEAINWKAQTEKDAYNKIVKTPVMQQAQALQREQKKLETTQIGGIMGAANMTINNLSKNKDVLEYAALSEKGAANNNTLEGADWDRYQQLKQSGDVQNYTKAVQQYQGALGTKDGQKFEQLNQQIQALQQTPQFKQAITALDVVQKNSAGTQAQSEAYVKKFPKQAFAEAYYKAEQQKVDAYYKRMSPVLKTLADMGTTLFRVPAAITGEIAAGATRAVAGVGEMTILSGTEGGKAIINDINTAADLISSVAEGLNSNMLPQPTNLQLPAYDSYTPYEGYRIYTNKRSEVIDIRDADGYAVPEDVAQGMLMQWEYEPNKPKKINSLNTHMILPRITQTAADLIVLGMAPQAGALAGLGHKASMVTYGYLTNYNIGYEEIKAADPFISESGAHLYANAKGIMMGGLLTLTPQSIFPGKDGNLVFKEIGKEYTKILAGGTTAKVALGRAMAKVMGKEGLTMAGIGFAMDLSDRGLKLAANTITDRPTQETEYTLNQAVETGVSMFVVGSIMAGVNKGWKGLRGDALYTGLKNYERTIGEMEQMANRGDISQQDFARASGILSQLKPIYDNLADMGKYNDAYKSSLIGLYAEKLKIEEKLGRTEKEVLVGDETGRIIRKGILEITPERDALVRQLNEIDSKIEALAIVNNPDFIVYTRAAEIQLDPRTKEIVDRYQKGAGITQEELDYLNSRVITGKQYVIDPKSGKVMAIDGGRTVDTDLAKDVFAGVQVMLPKYGVYQEEGQSKRVTRDELLEMLKDPIFLADFTSGRKGIEIFNDIEMESLVQRYTQPKEYRPAEEVKAEEQKLLTGRPKMLGVGGATVASSMGEPVKPTKGGPEGVIEQTETGIYFTDKNGKSTQLAVADKQNPTETLNELGYELVAPQETPAPMPKAEVELLPDNVTFNVNGEKLTWLKFNYGNNGELQTADMMLPDGSKVKIKDRDVVYDMAVQLSNNSRTRLAIPNERATADIADAVMPVREGFDIGMKAIDTIYGDVDPVVETVLESIEMDMEVDPDIHAAAELWLEDAIKRTEKIETQNVEEKQRVIEWAKGILGEVGTAKIAAKRPVQPELVAEGAGGKPVVEGEPVAPTEQRVYEFPELPSRAKALVKRLAGGKGEAEAERIVTTIKEAYQAEKAPAEELAKIGYGKQEYEKAVGEVVEALKPTVKTVPVEAKPKEPLVTVSDEEVVRQMRPVTDQMAFVEREFANKGYKIDTDYDNEIIVTDKNGDIVEPGDLSNFMQRLAAQYEGAVRSLGEYDARLMEQSLAKSREIQEVKAEEVTPELPSAIELAEPEVPAEYKYTTTQRYVANDIQELDLFIRTKAIGGRKLSQEEIEIYKAKKDGQKIRLELLLDENSNENLAVEEQLRRVKIKVSGVLETAKAAGQFYEQALTKKDKLNSNEQRLFDTLSQFLKPEAPAESLKQKPQQAVENDIIEGWIEDSEYSDYISYTWDGNVLEIFMSRDKAPVEIARQELIDMGVEFEPTPLVETEVAPVKLSPLQKARLEGINRLRAAQGKELITEAEYAEQMIEPAPAEIASEKTTQDIVRMLNEGLDWTFIKGNLGIAMDSPEMFNAVKQIMASGKYPSKKFPKANRFSLDEFTQSVAKNVGPIPTTIKKKDYKSIDNEVSELKSLVSKDVLRPNLQAVYVDGKRGNIIATNSNAIIIINSGNAKGKPSKLVNPKNGQTVDENVPNYYAVLPTSTQYNIEVSLPQLIAELNGVSKARQFFDGTYIDSLGETGEINVNAYIKYGDGKNDYVALNPEIALPYLKTMAAYGVEKVSIGVNGPNKGVMFYSDKGVTALIMPVMPLTPDGGVPDTGHKQILERNVQSGTTTNPVYSGRFDPTVGGEINEPYENYNSKRRDGGLLGFTANEPVVSQTKVGASQQGPINRQALIDFVKAVGVRENGVVTRKLGEHYGDIMSELSRIPGNIEVYRDMARGGKAIASNVFRFKIDGVPFNPIEYIKTGRIQGNNPEDINIIREQNLAQEAGDVGFNKKEINYRQEQFDFNDNPDTRSVEVKGDTPLKFRSVAEILDESIEKTGKDLTKALAESKLNRKLENGEYILKTSKIKASKDWDLYRKTTEIKSPADVAFIFRKLEDFNNEHVMIAMLDKDGKLFVSHISSGRANASIGAINQIIDHAISFNASKLWWVHNHPSGSMDFSDGDLEVNKNLRLAAVNAGIDFQGGIVVDWDKGAYSAMDSYGTIFEKQKSYYDRSEVGVPTESVDVNINWVDSKSQDINQSIYNKPHKVVAHVGVIVTRAKVGEAVKGGVLLMNTQLRIVGNLFLNGQDDIQTITKGIAATNATAIVTYGTFRDPILRVGVSYMDAKVLDHVFIQSKSFNNFDISSTENPNVVFGASAVDIPNVQELTLPYGDKASKLEKAVQKAMLDGFVTFDEVILNLYSDLYQGDAAKIRQNLQKIKDVYDEVSLLDQFLEAPISSIEDVARFDLDRFLINVNRPQRTEVSLRQQYNDFASWFEHNYPQYKFYYSVDIDPANGQAYFRIGKDPVQLSNGNTLYYGDWLGNKKWQKDWNEVQKSEIFNRPPMIWIDREIMPVPYQHVQKDQYAIGEDQEVAVNLILDRFIPKVPEKESKRGFMLGDGMGIGKTRIELVSANEMIKAKKLPVLIITKGANVVEQFQREAAALSMSNVMYRQEPDNVNDLKIVVGTYDDLTRGKVGNADNYAAVIFDEAHMLKNTGTQRTMTAQEFLKKAQHVVFATGTPMDKPVQLAYFVQHMTGKDLEESLRPVGLYLDNNKLKRLKNAPYKTIKECFLAWRTNMIKEGAYIRREYPFFGTADKVYIRFSEGAVGLLEQIKKTNGRNGVMAANRYQEHLKIPYILGETLKAVGEGKQVVVFCVGVNDTIIYPEGKKPKIKGQEPYSIEVPQFANEFSRKLKEAGVTHAKIYGPDSANKLEESRKFQRGDVKVAIATISSGGTGIDLDDQFGDAPREVIFATLPWSGNEFDQAQFRVSRRNTKTPSRLRFLFAENSWADGHKEGLVSKKMETLRLIQAGKDPDIIDMERWREDADGGLIDIVEDDFNEDDQNVSNPQPDQYVEALPTDAPVEITETPSEVKAKFESGDPATLQAVGVLPALIGGGSEYIKVTTENQANPEQEGSIEPTTPLGAASTKGQPTTVGGAKKQPTPPQRRSWWQSMLFGPAKQKSISTMVLEIYKELGIPTRGEYHMSPKYLGYYEHVTKDVSLKVATDIFVALHEAIHWADFSKLGGVTTRIQSSGDFSLIQELSEIHDKFYPGAKKSASLHTKIAEGLTMYMQMKLYDPDLVSQFTDVESKVFSPGGQYYGEIWDKVFDAFENLKNTIAAMSPLMQAGLGIADMNTPKSSEYTIDTWNFLAKRLFKIYDESIPLSLWDDKAGVGFGTAMERTTDEGKFIQSSQNAYFFFRSRNRLASNWIASDPNFVSSLLPSNPMFYDLNGEWTPGKYRMEDMINLLKKLEKADPRLLSKEMWVGLDLDPNETIDITKAYSQYLRMRRVFMDYQKRKDLETSMQLIIANGMQSYLDLQTISDPTMHEDMLADFNVKFVRPLQIAFIKWSRVNDIIGNEGGTYVQLNEDFSPSILAWSSPQFRNLHSKIYDPNQGNYVTDANSTQVYQKFNQIFSEVDNVFDTINRTMLVMMVSTGMLKPEKANEYIQDHKRYPGYASFQRHINNTFFDDPELTQIIGSDKVGKIKSTLQRKGSTREIVDPILSQAVMIHEVFRKGLKNLMWLRLANMSRTDEQLARGFMPIPTKYIPQKNSKGEVMYMKPVIPGQIDIPGQVLIYANGVGKYWQIADESLLAFYNAITELDGGKTISGIVNSRIYKAGVGAATMFTLMTTGVYPYWAIQNITVDQLSTWMNSKLGTIPLYTSVKNFLPAFGLAIGNTIGKQMESYDVFQKMFPGQTPTPKQLEYITEFMSLGGSGQTMMSQLMSDEQKATVQELFDVKPKGLLPKIKFGAKKLPKVVTWTVDFTSLPTNLSEIIARFSEYAEARKRGMSKEAAFRYSIETMPFPKRGASALARTYFPLVSYLRSSFTVAGKTLEEAIDQPKKFATVWASLSAAAALALINMWEDMEEDEKNYYMQADGTELAQYFVIPARFLGGPEHTMYRFRIPEIIGSAAGMGIMYGIALSTNKSPEYKQMAKALAANIPSAVNPYEWAAGDTSVWTSVQRQGVRLSPQIVRPLIGAYSGKTPTTSGVRPITPRSLEFYPSEFQYRIGSRGTSSVVTDISNNVTGPIGLSPIQTEYLIGEYTGRTGRFVLDYIDDKDVKSAFIRQREDYALRGRWYQDFYEKNTQIRARMTVINTPRDPIPSRDNKAMYDQWKDNLRNYAKEYTIYSSVDELLSEAYKVREHAEINDTKLPLQVYDKFDELAKSFYDNEPYDVRKQKTNEAFDVLKDAARSVKYKNVVFFAPSKYSLKFTGTELTRFYNKIYKQ